jgi:hypothetical protein
LIWLLVCQQAKRWRGEDNFFVAAWSGRGQEADPDPSG